jgi:hypothetical protein
MPQTQTDRTAEIFDFLGVTPEAQPWAYCPQCGGRGGFDMGGFDENGEGDGWFEHCECQGYPTISLLSDTLEADGLAVRLWKLACSNSREVNAFLDDIIEMWNKDIPFAAAVHDALVEALGIGHD